MADLSRRARRMERHHKLRKASPLNLVSLMDIFTILVFFLLVNSSNTQELPRAKDLKLPQSISKNTPQDTLIISITDTVVLVQGRKVADIRAIQQQNGAIIDGLKAELDFHAEAASDLEKQQGLAVTIFGDQNNQYEVIRKILTTCQQSSFTKVAFAANQVAKLG